MIKRLVLISLLVNALFVVAFDYELVRYVPGFRCESFGCFGLGIIYATIALLIPIIFFVVTALISKERRWRSACIAFGIALIGLGFAVVTIRMLR